VAAIDLQILKSIKSAENKTRRIIVTNFEPNTHEAYEQDWEVETEFKISGKRK
jgi:hypothetical protein